MDDTGVVREIETKPPPKLYNRFKQKILRKQGAAAKVCSYIAFPIINFTVIPGQVFARCSILCLCASL